MKQVFVSFLMISFSLCHIAKASVTASTNKQNFSLDEKIILTIKADEKTSAMPDLSILKNIFSVISNSVSKQHYIINGQESTETTWEFFLVPKVKGKINIPQIVVGNEKTNTVMIDISENQTDEFLKNEETEKTDEIYQLEAEVKTNSRPPFVQEKIDYLIRLKDHGDMQNISISFEEPSDFMIKQIEKPVVKILKDGRREVTFSYALFAQKSGEVKIPDVYLSGYVLQKPDVNTIFGGHFFQINMPSFFGIDAPITLEHKGKKINVLPALKDYKGNWWLPAENVELSSKFIDLPKQITKGSTITREITLKAVGLMDSQLPELDVDVNEDVKQYVEKPVGQTIVSDKKIIGIQKTLETLIIEKDGEIFLPEIKVPWYDINDGQIKTAVLKKERLFVQKDNLESEMKKKSSQNEPKTIKTRKSFAPYVEICLAFLTGILLTYFILKPKTEKKAKTASIDIIMKNSKDLRALRDGLIVWARKEYPLNHVSNLTDISHVFEDEDLNKAINSLSSALYDERKAEMFNEKAFKKALKNAIKNKKKKKTLGEPPIPPLYE